MISTTSRSARGSIDSNVEARILLKADISDSYGSDMPVVHCPIEGREYETPDVEPKGAAALITTHATSHKIPNGSTPTARVEKVKRPNISSASTTED